MAQRYPAPELPPWLAKQVPFERYCLDIGGYKMHVMESGEGHPILLLHGNPTWGFLYRKVAAALAGTRLRLIMPDLIGLGFSDKPRDPSAHSLVAHSEWIASLIDQLDLQNFFFVGQDWGGSIGLRALRTRGDRVRGMVFLNTAIGPPREGFKPTAFHRFSHLPVLSDLVFRGLGFPQLDLSWAQGDRSSIRGEVSKAYRYPLRRFQDRIAPLALTRMVPDSQSHPTIKGLQESAEVARNFKGPVQIVWGRRDPVIARALKRVRALVPHAVLTETQAGHFLQEEVPEEIAHAIRSVVRDAQPASPSAA